MNFNYNPKLESKNFVDGVDFTRHNRCIWNVYPAGSAGDLLASIINCHYGRTGSNYFGINENGQVIFRPSDYKITNIRQQSSEILFDQQHFFDIAKSLGSQNINYSMCDQFIFSCHLHTNQQIKLLLKTFPNCKVIRTYTTNSHGEHIIKFMSDLKNCNTLTEPNLGINQQIKTQFISHPNVLNIPFGVLFKNKSYHEWYDKIIQFLDLNGRLICFDYIEYYISKQHPKIKDILVKYDWQT